MKAVEVVLSDGRAITVHEPRTDEMPLFLRALSSMKMLGDAMSSLRPDPSGVELPAQEIPLDALDKLYPLLASVSGLTEEEIRALPFYEGLTIFSVMSELMPANFTRPRISG